MLEIFLNLFLILVIYFQIPQEDLGFLHLKTKKEFSNKKKHLLNIIITITVIFYFGTAIQLNIKNNY